MHFMQYLFQLPLLALPYRILCICTSTYSFPLEFISARYFHDIQGVPKVF